MAFVKTSTIACLCFSGLCTKCRITSPFSISHSESTIKLPVFAKLYRKPDFSTLTVLILSTLSVVISLWKNPSWSYLINNSGVTIVKSILYSINLCNKGPKTNPTRSKPNTTKAKIPIFSPTKYHSKSPIPLARRKYKKWKKYFQPPKQFSLYDQNHRLIAKFCLIFFQCSLFQTSIKVRKNSHHISSKIKYLARRCLSIIYSNTNK